MNAQRTDATGGLVRRHECWPAFGPDPPGRRMTAAAEGNGKPEPGAAPPPPRRASRRWHADRVRRNAGPARSLIDCLSPTDCISETTFIEPSLNRTQCIRTGNQVLPRHQADIAEIDPDTSGFRWIAE